MDSNSKGLENPTLRENVLKDILLISKTVRGMNGYQYSRFDSKDNYIKGFKEAIDELQGKVESLYLAGQIKTDFGIGFLHKVVEDIEKRQDAHVSGVRSGALPRLQGRLDVELKLDDMINVLKHYDQAVEGDKKYDSANSFFKGFKEDFVEAFRDLQRSYPELEYQGEKIRKKDEAEGKIKPRASLDKVDSKGFLDLENDIKLAMQDLELDSEDSNKPDIGTTKTKDISLV